MFFSPDCLRLENETGVESSGSLLTYLNIFSDVRETIDWVHNQVFMVIEQLQGLITLAQGTMKAKTLQDLPSTSSATLALPSF